ncbi:MAG: MnhB domain-containing protein [Lachnospiraceae bacterium]|nr:MnhB domain-containing protein [Lachnospiraceae bacterium]
MSRIREDYNKTAAYRFRHFVEGDLPETIEEPTPEELEALCPPEETHGHAAAASESAEGQRQGTGKPRSPSEQFVDLKERDPLEDAKRFAEMSGFRWFRRIYQIAAMVLCVCIIAMLIITVGHMPIHGSNDTPTSNEVMERYLEKGQEETGAPNLVTGMILQYRAFDTFGETNVLFISTCVVMLLLLMKKKEGKTEKPAEKDGESRYEPGGDIILQTVARVVVPMIMVFGFYILLNGHLSPGGGFSGGAVMGAGLILHCAAFGFSRTARFFNEKVYDIIKVGSLCLYAIIITYYLFTGANDIASIVPLGKVGNIISSGLILPINILVGLEVACTMYAFYAFFRKGGF